MTRKEAIEAIAAACNASLDVRSFGSRLINVAPDGALGTFRRKDGVGPAYELTLTNGDFGIALLSNGQATANINAHQRREREEAEGELGRARDAEERARARVIAKGGNPNAVAVAKSR